MHVVCKLTLCDGPWPLVMRLHSTVMRAELVSSNCKAGLRCVSEMLRCCQGSWCSLTWKPAIWLPNTGVSPSP